ncbi:MAG: site-2 protease family protein [Candidatus Cloacimonetes bacterium]|jgi:Zn-dependent protease|nr:site-2 protease family protein [Candidatus Cloacimonadota bacterium]MDY0337980.1 site-2 protease family protein [Candidatus Cloacimonadaceae bacterium]MCK9334749.1 site-2 protease family protein [Candidatus Cloacimonadota bacterium]MDD2544526.1 site-2 protease family protein [Candidatus Cloacimonadota bacterium]MDD2684288.1 site-2 protease family protein [Candidatus Cloacimonadota bacterium]
MNQLSFSLIRIGITAAIVGIVFYSIILHEISHAWAAYALGDDSAKRAGRLSLNPLKHIDIFGTIILPLILYFSAGFIYGYAKPVPFNPYNFRNFKRDSGLTALAGPLSNILIAILMSVLYHLSPVLIQNILYYVIFLNLLLAFFNLIPIPPLDGSKVLGMVLTDEAYFKWTAQERKGMIWLFGIIIASNLLGLNLIGRVVLPPVQFVMKLLGLL